MAAAPATFVWNVARQSHDRLQAELAGLADSLFEGHYPNAPVLAGALLVDSVRQAVAQWQAATLRLSELISARYYSPIFPGDRVSLEVQRVQPEANIVQASIHTARGRAATIKAAFEPAAPQQVLAESPQPADLGAEAVSLDQPAIRRLLPHRFPMLLIDRATVVQDADGVVLVARKAVTACEPCYARVPEGEGDWHYPEVLVMESFCQGCGVLRASVGRAPGDDRVPVLARIVRFRFSRPVFPGCVLEHRVRIEASTADGAVFQGDCRVDGVQVARVERIVAALARGIVDPGG